MMNDPVSKVMKSPDRLIYIALSICPWWKRMV